MPQLCQIDAVHRLDVIPDIKLVTPVERKKKKHMHQTMYRQMLILDVKIHSVNQRLKLNYLHQKIKLIFRLSLKLPLLGFEVNLLSLNCIFRCFELLTVWSSGEPETLARESSNSFYVLRWKKKLWLGQTQQLQFIKFNRLICLSLVKDFRTGVFCSPHEEKWGNFEHLSFITTSLPFTPTRPRKNMLPQLYFSLRAWSSNKKP